MLKTPVLLLVDYVPELKFYQKVSENFPTSGSHKNLGNGCFLANISLNLRTRELWTWKTTVRLKLGL